MDGKAGWLTVVLQLPRQAPGYGTLLLDCRVKRVNFHLRNDVRQIIHIYIHRLTRKCGAQAHPNKTQAIEDLKSECILVSTMVYLLQE